MNAPEVTAADDREAGIWAVVVNWNGGERILTCLASLESSGISAARIVLVDNGSSDGSLDPARELFPQLVVLTNATNLGFGAGANRGARHALDAGAEAIFWVNDDVTLPEGTLSRLAEALNQAPRMGLVGPRVLYPVQHAGHEAKVWAAGGDLDWRRNLSTLIGHGELDGPELQKTRAVDYVPGCALLARRACLEEVGLFEESYFAYMEDVELGLRARQANWGVTLVGEVHAVHDASASTGGGYTPRRKYMQALNSVRFLREYGNVVRWLRFGLFDLASLPILFVAGLFNGRARAVLAKGLGIWHGILGRQVTGRVLEPGGTWLW